MLGAIVHIFRVFSNINLVRRLRASYGYSFLTAAKICGRFALIQRTRPDVVHVHHIQVMNAKFMNFLSVCRLPWIVSLRGYEVAIRPLLSHEDQNFIINILHCASGIHTVSEDLRSRAIDMGAAPEKITVIRRTPEINKPITITADYSQQTFDVTTICRFNWKKGLVFLLQGLRLLLDRKISVTLHICGDGDKSEVSELLYWIWLLNLKDNVIMHGRVTSDRLDEILKKTHVYVQPSINEGIPNTLLRVLACKIPVVASAVDGIPEVITNEVHGILVKPGDPHALAEGIDRILKDAELRTVIRHATLKNVALNPEVETNAYDRLYDQMTSQ